MYFFRVIHDSGRWLCRRGRHVLEEFDSYEAALALAEAEASAYRPSAVIVHDAAGRVETVARFA